MSMSISLHTPRRTPRCRMQGLSLVELMVGVAVSLFVVAAAAMLVSAQLSDNRRLLLETQLQQDLRATADIVTRELRRSSYWGGASNGVPTPGGSAITSNPMTALTLTSSSASTVNYRYRRGPGAEAFGFRLDTDGVIRVCQSDGSGSSGMCNSGWQELTDPATVKVTRFEVQPVRSDEPGRVRAQPDNTDPVLLPCPNLCADGTTDCWPRVGVREFEVILTGEARTDSSVVRTLKSSVRVRNDRVVLSTEAPAGQSCPGS